MNKIVLIIKLKSVTLKMIDLFLCLICIILGLVIMPVIMIYLVFNKIKQRNKSYHDKKRLLLFSESADYESLKAKGSLPLLDNFLCGGYFEKVYVVHFPAIKTQNLYLNDSLEIIEFGVKARFIKHRNLMWSYYLLNSMYYFWKVLRMQCFALENVSVIQGAGVHHTGLAALFLHWLTKLPVCVSVHSDDDFRYKFMKDYGAHWKMFGSRLFTIQIQKVVFSKSPRIFIIRHSLKNWVIRRGAYPDRIRIYPHGINIKNFFENYNGSLKIEFNLSYKRLAVFAGRLSMENYVYDIPKIANSVKSHIPNILFLMIGDGPERKKLENLVVEMGLKEQIRFLGFQPQNKVFEFRKIADINLCLMSGYSLIEAALSGKPVIAYDVEWHHELIKNEETGFLIPEHNISMVADSIIKLIEDPDLSSRLGDNAKRLAMEMHDVKKTFKEKAKLYEELVEELSIKN